MASDPNAGVCLIRRVVIRNYKSIAAYDVILGPVTFLVGPNGSGKSNFLDAICFVSDSLRNSLDHALRDRGGFREIVRRTTSPAAVLGIRVDFRLPNGTDGYYAFEIGGLLTNFAVEIEECVLTGGPLSADAFHSFRIVRGEVVTSSLPVTPAAVKDRLYLANLSGTPEFRPLYDALSRMGFYNINPDVLREFTPPDPGELLARDGVNLPSALSRLANTNPLLKARIEDYLGQVVPGIVGVETLPIGPRETLQFRQRGAGSKRSQRFMAANMSDGTLRALGVLVALFQSGGERGTMPLLVGLEEPETALHPAAAGVLVDSIRDAASMRQVLVTSHSPDLLDNPSIADFEILAVVAENGETRIGPLDEAGRSVLRDHLFTAGDLLRMNQLRPHLAAGRLDPSDVVLFGTGAPA
jgi:predicted ATPase